MKHILFLLVLILSIVALMPSVDRWQRAHAQNEMLHEYNTCVANGGKVNVLDPPRAPGLILGSMFPEQYSCVDSQGNTHWMD